MGLELTKCRRVWRGKNSADYAECAKTELTIETQRAREENICKTQGRAQPGSESDRRAMKTRKKQQRPVHRHVDAPRHVGSESLRHVHGLSMKMGETF